MSVSRNSAFNVVGAVIPLIVSIVTIPLYLHEIGSARYGALAVCWLILGYFGLFDMGLGRATTQRIAALHEDSIERRATVVWTATATNAGIGIVGGIIVYFGAGYFFRYLFEADAQIIAEVLDAVPILALSVPVATLTGVASGALQGRERFLEVNLSLALSTSLFQILPLIAAYLFGPKLLWLVIAAAIGRLSGLALVWLQTHRHLTGGIKPAFDQAEWRKLLPFGGWIFVTTMVGAAVLMADRLFIGSILGAGAVAIYAVAYDIAQRTSLLPKSLVQALFPRFSRDDDTGRKALMARSLDILNLIMTPPIIGAIFIIKPFLILWLGSETGEPASKIGAILLIAYWANAFAMIPYARLQAQGRPDIVAWITFSQTPVYVCILFLTIDAFGLIGAAVTVAVRCVLEVGVMLFYVERPMLLPPSIPLNLTCVTLATFVATEFPVFHWVWLMGLPLILAITITNSWLLAEKQTRLMIIERFNSTYLTIRQKIGVRDA